MYDPWFKYLLLSTINHCLALYVDINIETDKKDKCSFDMTVDVWRLIRNTNRCLLLQIQTGYHYTNRGQYHIFSDQWNSISLLPNSLVINIVQLFLLKIITFLINSHNYSFYYLLSTDLQVRLNCSIIEVICHS